MATTKQGKLRLPTAWRRPDVLLASFIVNAVALALPMVVLQVYDRVIPNQATETFSMLLLLAIVVTVLDGVVRVLRAMLVSWSSAQFEHRASLAAMRHILRADTMAFETIPSGTHLERVQAIEHIQEFFSGQSMLLAVDVPFAILFLTLIWSMTGHLVLVPLALLGLFLVIALWAGWGLTRALRKRATMDDRRQNFIIEVLGAAHTVKSMAMEKLMMRRYERLQGTSAHNITSLGQINSIVQGMTTTISHLAMIGFVSIGSYSVVAGDLTTGALAAGTMMTGRVLQPGLRALALWTSFQKVRLSIEKVNGIFALPQEHPGTFIPPQRVLRGNLKLDDVHFSYPGVDHKLLRGISLNIAPREAISITGRNGSGKSTLVGLMMGFLDPDQGDVRVDGRNVHQYDLEFLRAQISLMPQKGILFEGTVLDNMTLFREGDATRQAAILAQTLGLDAFLARLPDGLDTQIGGSAVDALPEGVKQKIIMIRALIGNPRVMIFDDANANFDMVNDRKLVEFIKQMKGKRTLVIVSHRPSILRLADRQFVLENGVLLPRTETPPKPFKAANVTPLERRA